LSSSASDFTDELRSAVSREVERSLLRTRNGIKHVAGIGHARVGLTPKTTVWSRHKAELWRYTSDSIEHQPPILFVFSLLSRSYVLDLRPGYSLIERLRDEGFDVYLLDWGVADASDAGNTLETYIDDYLSRAIDAVCRESESDGVTLFGYCLGATLAAMFVAGHPEAPVDNLIAVAAPIDLAIATGVNALFDPTLFNADEVIDETGNVPPDVIRTTFQMLKPTSQAVVYANLWQNLWNDEWVQGYQAMAQWTREHIPLSGAAFRQLQELGELNALVEGGLNLSGRTIELASIRCPILNVIAERDHVVPVEASEPLTALSSSDDATDLRLPMGHMTLLAGREAMKTTVPTVIDWMKEHSTA
jgi:polyhydroxyalkanoate synthase